MTESEPKKSPSESLLAAQLTRAAEDYRQLDQLIWQIPTLAITVTSVVIAVSFGYVHIILVSGGVLLVGGFFDFTLAIALAKARLMEDGRLHYLKLMEAEYQITHLPVESKETLDFLPKDHKHRGLGILREQNAFVFLLATVILLSVLLFALGIGQIVYSLI
jgi:hypothetical protein